ncbi:hypothetical protein LZK98_11485 [Sphingomonas cannabina]|uniref:hypothetical protein n=1 Tax=Sphingomonas cannabina TaxID=2899123 RepID=UPI001F1C41AA|nr:hypothetical protein [Sphingomonas cannabina]UIJ43712.1 hypothetical protein LZK98_11485 [Sphingomonas cannabina]
MIKGENGGEYGDRWCVLRMAGPRTLSVASSLERAGLEVWTPIEIRRTKRQRGNEFVERPAPILPTFVFARARHLPAIISAMSDPTRDHPPFSVFRYNGRAPLLADTEIERLREVERRLAPKPKARHRSAAPLEEGQRLRMMEGGFAGISGVVRKSDGRYTLVGFGGWMEIQIDTFVLREDMANGVVQVALGSAVE